MTLLFLALSIILSIIALTNTEVMRKMIFNPYKVNTHNEWWRFISSGFIHADWMHLLVNMFVLLSFGQVVESRYDAIFGIKGQYYFVILYLGAIIISNAPSYVKYKTAAFYNSLGASGAIAAIMFAAILFAPWSKVYLFGIIGIPGIILGPLYLIYEYKMGKEQNDHINHDAHFWGAIFGIIFTIALKPIILLGFIEELLNF
jgi:membrane associated rhomboid family serine protease